MQVYYQAKRLFLPGTLRCELVLFKIYVHVESVNVNCLVIFLDFHLTKQGLSLVDSWSHDLD